MLDRPARVLAIRDGAGAKVASERERNRRDMPELTAFFDPFFATFGRPQHVRMTEGGRTVDAGAPLAYTRAVQASGNHLRRRK